MSLFHLIKYPIDNSMTFGIFEKLPKQVLDEFYETHSSLFTDLPPYEILHERIVYIRKLLMDLEDDDISCN